MTPTHGISTTLFMVYRTPYPWYIDLLPTEYRPPTHGISTPYPWYFDPPLPMAYQPPYPWYFDPPIHGMSTPLPMVFWPSSHGILTPYPWYFDPPFPWYIDPPTHGVSKPLLWYYEPLPFGRNDGGKFTMRGFKIQWRKIDPRVTISYENWPRGQYTMEVKIPYDTGKCLLKVEHIRGHL